MYMLTVMTSHSFLQTPRLKQPPSLLHLHRYRDVRTREFDVHVARVVSFYGARTGLRHGDRSVNDRVEILVCSLSSRVARALQCSPAESQH